MQKEMNGLALGFSPEPCRKKVPVINQKLEPKIMG